MKPLEEENFVGTLNDKLTLHRNLLKPPFSATKETETPRHRKRQTDLERLKECVSQTQE